MPTLSRKADHPINPLFLARWSPRAFSEAPIPERELFQLFEAARWAPSAFNAQPWRFLYARRDTKHWPAFLDLLHPFNRVWAHRAAALVIVLSRREIVSARDGSRTASHSHSFDAGAATAYLALEGARIGWHAHMMTGFDIEAAAERLNIPSDHRIEAAIAIGRMGDPNCLDEKLRSRESPNGRLGTRELVFEGPLPVS
ncbi:nitroreductase family protein [Rhodoligotrophos ferricapiens]|uniref:nitroreductase family protein n=1 Tax=Rhodoligotrophos ferricapiens TaxID=3069264 RepID=UPI00315CF8C4